MGEGPTSCGVLAQCSTGRLPGFPESAASSALLVCHHHQHCQYFRQHPQQFQHLLHCQHCIVSIFNGIVSIFSNVNIIISIVNNVSIISLIWAKSSTFDGYIHDCDNGCHHLNYYEISAFLLLHNTITHRMKNEEEPENHEPGPKKLGFKTALAHLEIKNSRPGDVDDGNIVGGWWGWRWSD